MEQLILKQTNFNKLRDEARKNENKELVFPSDDDELNRKVLEKIPIKILLINLKKRKDFQKQRNSGFNQVMAKIAKKKSIKIGINLDEIIESKGKEKAEILARLKQNIFLCKKNNLKMKFIAQNKENERDIYDLKSLGLVLGMNTHITKEL